MWAEKELQGELQELLQYREWINKRIGAIEVLLEPPPLGINVNVTIAAARVARGGRLKEMADAIFPFLDSHQRPARREAIFEYLKGIDFEVTGNTYKQKLATISSALSRDPRFRSMGRSTGQWDIDREHINRVSMLQDRQEFRQDPSVHQPSNNDTPHYEQIQQSAATESEQVSDADDLPW